MMLTLLLTATKLFINSARADFQTLDQVRPYYSQWSIVLIISRKQVSYYSLWAAIAVCSTLVSGCTPITESRGHLPTAEALAQIQPGIQKDDVQTILGTPSSYSVFGEEIWYYVSSVERRFAFYRPQELERKIIIISFNDGDAIKEIKTYSLEDGRQVKPVPSTTPVAGSELPLLQQLLGNVGRFNKSKQQGE